MRARAVRRRWASDGPIVLPFSGVLAEQIPDLGEGQSEVAQLGDPPHAQVGLLRLHATISHSRNRYCKYFSTSGNCGRAFRRPGPVMAGRAHGMGLRR
jgi:hypothetical protein